MPTIICCKKMICKHEVVFNHHFNKLDFNAWQDDRKKKEAKEKDKEMKDNNSAGNCIECGEDVEKKRRLDDDSSMLYHMINVCKNKK